MGGICFFTVGEITGHIKVRYLDRAEFLKHLGMHREQTFARRRCAFANDGNRELEQIDHVRLESVAGSALAPGTMHHAVGNQLRGNGYFEVNQLDSLFDRDFHRSSRVQTEVHVAKIKDISSHGLGNVSGLGYLGFLGGVFNGCFKCNTGVVDLFVQQFERVDRLIISVYHPGNPLTQ